MSGGDWVGRRVLDRDGGSIGPIAEIFDDRAVGGWAFVRCGGLRPRRRHVPLRECRSTGSGVVVPFDAATVRASPALGRHAPSAEDAERLVAHYGIARTPAAVPDPPAPPRQDGDELARVVSAAHYHEDRLRLYRAKAHGTRPTSDQRLRELERASDQAQTTLGLVRARQSD